jgi:hypothetical protein
MKKAWIAAYAFLLVSVAGFAQTPSQDPLTSAALAAILGEPAVTRSCAGQQSGVVFAASPLGKSACTARATCVSGITVSCSGTGTCTSVDYNCAVNEPGHVTCDGVTTTCSNCCIGTTIQRACCRCADTGDCWFCCRCGGGSGGICGLQCG